MHRNQKNVTGNTDTLKYQKEKNTEPIVLVIMKSACFLIHALLPRDLKARGLKSAGLKARGSTSRR
jgi:hypothetical protein